MTARWLPVALLVLLAAGLGGAVLAMPETAAGLQAVVNARLPESGVESPVTAVLLNFRGYDTLLELSVLSLAVIGIWSLAVMPERRVGAPGLVLEFLVQVLVPFLVLLGAYLLWAGSHAAGGAFQAAAVFAAALVLMLLGGAPLPAGWSGWPLRALLMLGPAVFVLVAAAVMLGGRRFLELPPGHAKYLILVIEAAASLSIAVVLAVAIRGGRPERNP